MARIEDLIDEMADPALRDEIARQVKFLKSTKRFGLVFEDHVPETVTLHGLTIRVGSVVQNRIKPEENIRYRVVSIENGKATIVPVGLDEPVETVASEDLMVVKAFEEPIFPGLTPVGEVRHGPDSKPAHTVINGENFHALQLLAYTHAETVDIIYIDPPYNTGARDWKYNNHFVDNNDAWRHSKWLAMMEKRLRLSRKLLKPHGVLIVTIDEHEVHHLGVLLEELYPDARRQMITTVVNPGGVAQSGLSRVEEYALICFLGEAEANDVPDDLLSPPGRKQKPVWLDFVRYGNNSRPSDRPNMSYPIAYDPSTKLLVAVGLSVKDRIDAGEVQQETVNQWLPDPKETLNGHPVVWPIRGDGSLGCWEQGIGSVLVLAQLGFVKLDIREGRTPRIRYVRKVTRDAIDRGDIETFGREHEGGPLIIEEKDRPRSPKTVWNRKAHGSGTYGSSLLRSLLGRKAFDFPKSLYLTADTLKVVDGDTSVVLDFFAGSGTTLHAVAMLNAQDGGNRHCILITNNDVSEAEAILLGKSGHFAGDPAFEAEGIFESVTKPRVEAAITGIRPDGEPVEGKYLDQYLPNHSYAEGFKENVAFFRMDYLEPDLVELGRQYNAVAPLLWMAAGAVGHWEEWDGRQSWSAPADSTYAVLFDLAEAAAFTSIVESRREITHVWFVTDSHSAFIEVREELPDRAAVGQLYREYLRNFTVNALGVLD